MTDVLDQLDRELDDREARWDRAFTYAIGQSFGPIAHEVPEPECSAVLALAARIEEVGMDAAWDEYIGGAW